MPSDVEKRVQVKYILDDTGFNGKLQGINQQLKLNRSELKNAQVGMQAFGKSSEGLRNVQQALSNQIETQSKKVNIYGQSLDKAYSKMQQNVAERDRLKTALDQERAKLEGATQAYGKNSQVTQNAREKVNELNKQYREQIKVVEDNAKSVNNATINMQRAESELTRLQGQLNKVNTELAKTNSGWLKASKSLEAGSKSFKTIGEGANNAGNKILGITAPLVGVGVAAGKIAMDFETSMSQAAGALNKPQSQMANLRELALQTGKDTQFSATQAGNAITELAKGGLTEAQIKSGALKSTMDLAASSGMDLGNAANTVVQAMGAFGVSASESTQAVNALAGAAAASSTDVEPLSQGLAQCAAQAHMAGWSIQDTTAVLGSFADAGVVGSDAGTSLKVMLQRLGAPTDDAAAEMKTLGINIWDSNGHMKNASGIAQELQTHMGKLSDSQKQAAMATIFGSDATRAASILMNNGTKGLEKYTKATNDQNAASRLAASQMGEGKKAIEQMMGSLETAGIKLADNFAPMVKSTADTIGRLADAFGDLDPSTQKMIVNATLASVALGGTLKVVGGFAGSIGNILGLMGKFSGSVGTARIAMQGATAAAGAATTATAGVGAATAGAAAGAGGLAAGLGTLAVAAAPWILAAGAVAGAGFLIYKHFSKEAVPSVDLFSNKVKENTTVLDQYGNKVDVVSSKTVKFSDATKKQVGAYMELDKSATQSLTNMYVNGTVITDQIVGTMTTKYSQMTAQIKTGIDQHYQDRLTSMQTFFTNSNTLSDAEEAAILAKMKTSNASKKAEIDGYQQQILAIWQNAVNNHRGLTEQEEQQIASLQAKMKNDAITNLSQTEVEAGIIRQRIKDYGTKITAEQASNIIHSANETRDKSVQAANEQYNRTLANIIQMRDGTHEITADQAEKLIADAKRQRDNTVNHAEGMRNDVVKKVVSMNSSVSQNVDTTTGDIKTKWQKVKDYWDGLSFPEKVMKVTKVMTTISRNIAEFSTNPVGKLAGMARDLIDNNASGTNNFRGGLTTMHEKGYEVYNLPRGSRIYNHEASEDLVNKTAESVATKVAASVLGDSSVSSGTAVTNIYIDSNKIGTYITPIVSNNIARSSRRKG